MTKRILLTTTGTLLILCLALPLFSQPLSFRSLGSAEGMRTLTSWHCTYDGFGYLWVSTSDGLVRYNGNEVSYYYTQTHPGLPSDPTGYLFCDSKNNLWVCTPKGLTKADPNRILKRQYVLPEEPDRQVNFCLEDSRGFITALSRSVSFQQQSSDSSWIPQPWLDSIVGGARIRDVRRFDKDSYLIILPSRGVSLINLKKEKEIAFFPMPGVSHADKADDSHVFISWHGPFALYIASVESPDLLVALPRPPFFVGNDSKTSIEHLTMAANGKLYMATGGGGLVEYDHGAKSYYQYTHEPANPFSIAENSLRYIISDSSGNIAFTSLSGANFTNVRPKPVEYINYFKTTTGDVYDDRVISIAEDTLHQLWVVMEKDVVIMSPDRQITRRLMYPPYFALDNSPISVQYATADDHGRIWVAFLKRGIGIFNTDGKLLNVLSSSTFPGHGNAIERVRIMKTSADGYMYVGAENGLFRIDQMSLAIDTFPEDTAMAPLRRSRIVDILPLIHQCWVSTSPGGAAWHYSFATKTLKKYNSTNGLLSDRVYALAMDNDSSIYIGSYAGLSIIHPDGSIKNLNKGNGLPSTRIDAIVKAEDGIIWMTNTYNLVKFDPREEKMIKIVNHSGISRVNYQIMSSAVLSSGDLVFGTHKGMVIVDGQNEEGKADLHQIFVFSKNASGHEFLCSRDQLIRLKANQQLLRFSFGINDILLANQMVYRYKLTSGNEGTWSESSHLSRVDFNLKPGSYLLEVEASDGNEWISAPGPFQIRIEYPWWRKWWVISITGLIAILSFWFYFRNRIEKYKKELSIARQIADLESKALRAQMNPHFVFNSLNAIQECIVTGKIESAYTYLSQFSRLLRLVLEHSDVAEVSLHEELEVLSLFVSLEKLRFRNDMQYDMIIDDGLDQEEIRIPPMLIQPHLENAIWHGLRNKQGDKGLTLSISEKIPGYLTVMIEDNGIGRVQAEILRQGRLGAIKHKSKGKQLSGNRMELLKSSYPLASMSIQDLYHEDGRAAGTQVQLVIPILESGTKIKSEA